MPNVQLPKVTPPQPNADLGDAITYVKNNPKGFIEAVKTLVGFFAALLRRKR